MNAPPPDGGPERATVLRAPSPVKGLVLCALVVGCVVLLRTTPLGDLARLDELGEHVTDVRSRVEGLGAWGPLAFGAAVTALVAIGVPRLALAALAGALFEWLPGAALAQAASIVGCLLTFAVGRGLGRDFVAARVASRFPRVDGLLGFIGRHGFAANVLLRAAPVGNCFLTNLLMSVSPVRLRDFLAGTFVGTLPETVVFAVFGSAAGAHEGVDSTTRVVVGGVMFAALAVGTWIWFRRSALARDAGGEPGS